MVYGHIHEQILASKWIQRDMQSFCMNLIAWLGSQHKHGTIIQTFYILTEMNKLLKSRIALYPYFSTVSERFCSE